MLQLNKIHEHLKNLHTLLTKKEKGFKICLDISFTFPY